MVHWHGMVYIEERKTVREWTEDYNLTALARRINVDSSTLYRWILGERIPSGKNLQRLAIALRVGVNQIKFEQSRCDRDHSVKNEK